MANEREPVNFIKAIKSMSSWMWDSDELVIECEGYELVPYAIEVDESRQALVIRCDPPEDADYLDHGGPDEDDDDTPDYDDDEVLERPIESLDITDEELKEG